MKSYEVTKRIRKANELERPLGLIKRDLEKILENGPKIRVESKKSKHLDEETRKWCFKLLENNMRKIYEASKSGWNEKEKLREMFEPKAYYLIAYETDSGKPMGFCHFRFDMDFDNEVIYCYELQIEQDMRKMGIGKILMSILESLSQKLELEKVILTCSKFNSLGQRFFKETMKYTIDETDPNDQGEKVDYEILSKIF